MSNGKSQQDPSMEEILSSIRRIISEDDEASASAEENPDPDAESSGGGAAGEEDVLELTQMVQDDGSTVDLTQEATEAEPTPEPKPEPGPAPEVEAPAAKAEPAVPESVEKLISEEVASASVDTLSKLARAAEPEPIESSGLKFSESGRTVDDLVVELIRPMLREWLDRNLPTIVERLVQKEIRKLVRQAEPD